MNRWCWRVIFSRVKAMLIVVSDIARTGRAAVAGRTLKHPQPPLFTDGVPAGMSLSVLTFSVMLACGLVSAPATARSVIHRDTAAPGHQQPDIMSTANGLPQVNIQTPSAGGVSLNKYTQFDVDNRGVILNNARKPVQTQLGGWVTGNPYLARGEAKVIVNEVNARQPSQLNGYVEVAGKRARVVIASPAGITCNGCGFINANKATLTTGQVRMQNDRIAGYDVSRGTVTVQGKGMDARDASTTEIFARAVKLNAEIQAGELTVVTGQNTIVNREGQAVSADAVTVNTDDGSAKPVFALDSSALGGMYANKITFIGTEKGVGVNMEGDTASMPGDIILTADGTIRNKGSLAASGTVNITSVQGDVINQGRLEAQQTLSLSAGGQLRNTASGYVTTERDIQADAARGVDNHGHLYAAGNARIHTAGAVIHNGSLMTGGDLSLTAASLDAGHDSLLAAGADRHGNKTGAHNLTLTTTGPLVNRGNLSVTGQAALKGGVVSLDNATAVADNLLLNATTGALSITGSQLQADDTLALISPSAVAGDNARLRAQRLRVSTPALSAADGVLVQTGPDDLQLNISQEINISGGTLATRGHNLTLATPVLKADGGTLTHTGNGRFLLDAGMFSGAGVTLHSNGGLVLNSHAAGLNDATLTAESLSVHADSLDIRHGTLYQTGRGSMNVRADGHLDYSDGSLLSAGSLSLQTDTLTGTEGRLAAITDADISTHSLMNPRGKIQAGNTLTLSATRLDNTDGLVTSGQDMVLSDSSSVNNIRGTIAAGGTLQFLSTGLDNSAGLLQSGHDMLLDTHGGTLINRESSTSGIISLGNLTLRAGTLDNTDGWLSSNGWTNATTGDMDNSRGAFGAQQNLSLSALNLTSVTGLIHSDTGLTLTTGALINTRSGDSGGIISQGNLSINSGYLDNTAGLIQSAQDMTVDTGTNALINQDSGQQGGIISAGRLALSAGVLNNRDGVLTAGSDVTVTAGSTDNRNGVLGSQRGALDFSVNDTLNNGGLIQARRDIRIDTHHQAFMNAGAADATSGRILSGGNITLTGGRLDNTRGLIQSSRDIRIDTGTTGIINQNSGEHGGIISGGRLSLVTGELSNRNGLLTGQSDTTVTSGPTDNRGGMLASNTGRLTLNSGELDNSTGRIQAGTDLQLDARGQRVINTDTTGLGGILSQGTLTLKGGLLNNACGTIAATGTTGISIRDADNTDGRILSGGTLSLLSDTVNNLRGLLQSAGMLTLDTRHHALINTDSGSRGGIIAAGDVRLDTGRIEGDRGVLTGQNVIINTGNDAFSHQGGRTDVAGNLHLETGQLDNHGGLIRTGGNLEADTHGQALINTNSGTDGGLFSNGWLTLSAGILDNQDGTLLSRQNADITAGRTDNHNGTLASLNGTLTLNAGETQNAGGLIQSAGALWLDTQNAGLDNSDHGAIRSGSGLTLRSGGLNNPDGVIAGQACVTVSTGNLTNTGGSITGGQDMTLTTLSLTSPGGLIRADGALSINTQGRPLVNTGSGASGGLVSLSSLTMTTGVLANQTGFIASGGAVSLTAGTVSNQNGLLAGNGGLTVNSLAFDNAYGTLRSSADLSAVTQSQTFTNTHGVVSGGADTRIISGALDNTSGRIQGITGLALDTGNAPLSNTQGTLISAGVLSLLSGVMDNTNGQLQSAGNATLNLTQRLDNTAGLLRGGQTLNITAPVIINHDTRSEDKGAEAQTLLIQTADMDNTQGALRAAIQLDADLHATLNNTGGLISSEGGLNIHDGDASPASAINNDNGIMIAGTQGQVRAASLQGKGQVLSQGNLSLSLSDTLDNTGRLAADGDLQIDDAQDVSNSGDISAGQTLTLRALNIRNQADGNISALNTDLTARGTFDNTGLVDGGLTRIIAATLNNTGTGRLYGDHVALQAGTLSNQKTAGDAPVIAARERLDVGADTVTNTDHALLYSGGDMAFGGQLNSQNLATGAGRQLDNHSAQIDADGNLSLHMQTVDNRDIHLALSPQPVEVSREHHHEFQLDGGSPRYDAGDPRITAKTGGREHRLTTPEGGSKDFNEYYYDRVTAETQVIHQDPAEILAGGALSWQGVTLTNQDSRVIAGGDLTTTGVVNNQESEGVRRVTDTDQGTPWAGQGDRRHKKPGRRISGKKKKSKVKTSPYGPYVTTTTLPLHLMRYEGNTPPTENVPALPGRQPAVVIPAASSAGTPVTAAQRPANIPLTPAVQSLRSLSLPASPAGTSADGHIRDVLAGLKPAPALSAVPPGSAFSDLSPSLRARPLALPPGQHFTLTLLPADGHDATEIRMAAPDIRLPDNRLFDIHPENQTGWLVETAPRFTQKKQWLGTDYMQQALSTSPDRLMKRLGDGWYEQKLVREQVIALTGQRYLYGYGDDETQLRALMNNGIAFAHEYHLTPGIALSPEQMALLTSDMVWLVNDTVTLPDGTRQTVQVPQLYVRARPGDLSGNGALLAGRSVTISSPGHVTNSGLISGRDVTRITSQSLTNSGSLLGPKIDLQARENINNTGGRIIAGSALALLAGHDISSTTTLRTDGTDTGADRTAGIYVQQPGGSLTLQALGNITLTASRLENTGAGSTTRLLAGQDIRFDTLTTSRTENHDWGKHEYLHQFWQNDLASHLTTQGDLTLTAGQDIHATAADVSAGGTLSARAGRDIRLDTGTATRDITENSRQTSGGVLSKSRVETHDEVHDRQAVSTTFSGDTVSLLAGNNISIYGSNVAGTRDVGLLAGNDLNITTALESHQESHLKKEKKSGLTGSGGIGFTVGSSSQKSTTEGQGNTQLGSTVGSQRGDLTLSAGRNATLHGSDLVAGGNLSVTGQNVSITAAENTQTTLQKFERHQSGLTVALSGAVGSALNTAIQNVQQSRQPQDARLQALGGVKAALSGIQAAQALELNNAQQAAQQAGSGEEAPAAFGVTASIGSQSSASEQKTESHTVSGSSLNAGHDIRISATGDGQGHGGDILIQGRQAKAAHDIELDAQRDIQLLSALNTETLSGKNSSHGGSVGVGINVGQNTGITVSAGVNAAKGHENGTTLTHTNTDLDAGHHVTLNAGRDATLKGARVSGEKITADVKRNLTLQSGQDSDHYDSKQQSASAGASFTWGAGAPSASVSLSQDKIHSNFDSVKEQTGLFAGKEGFDVTTGQHTQLDGAVIASTADKTKNRLDTGTLGFSDIHNQADFSAQHQGITAGTGGSTGSQLLTNMATNTLSGVNTSGHDSSTTHAAVSDGSLIVRNTADQTQDISALSRDTDHAANGLSPVFDKEKVQRQLQQAQMVSDISSQILDIYNTHEAVSANRKATKEMQEASARENARTQAEKELTAEQKKNPSLKVDEERITQRAWQNLYNQALKANDARVGDPVRQAVTASVAVLSGLAGGDIKAALANGAAPYLATGLKRVTGGDTPSDEQMAVRLMGHAIIGGVVAELNGAPASGGAAGAVTGEVAAITISRLYFGKPPSELSESEREQLSGMSTVAAALAGSLASASSSGTVAGARAGNNAVENNFLGATSSDKLDKAVEKIKNGDKSLATANELIKLENADKRSDALVSKFTKDPSQMTSTERAELAGYLRVYASEMENAYGPAVAQQLVTGLLSGQDYMKRAPDSEAMSKAQSILNTWGYHKSNASIGDAPLMFGSSVLGTTIREGMALNAAIGVGVNSAAQLAGQDPFSYVDAIMAGVTAAATTGKSWQASAAINMGGAAIGSSIKGEAPTNSVIGTGLGSVVGSGVGKVISGSMGSTVKKGTSDIISNVGGSITSEAIGSVTKGTLDEADKATKK
ncbi:filamentous hemagglutinin [Salmonella enterica]|uniref:Filamentous hemagglutinin n=1 Tax=Salmonella enterica TaxID=28901 RepID=A0A5U0PQG1_SALER|nr:filamentous hemagglutinin [Salmonella enterica]EDX0903174.1 filamentous hemagglutinin N-terminal domain-containing protein [Salmonella enterica subsp. enterica]EEG6050925.1 filamentous hemagglutinin N-terminal domain-containing protein [Salmonella enterica subsp. enterica]EHY2294655.1 hemagglutinin repeat-containing protein [Salmonella enterica]EIZ0121872.1 hemagglutinin repeat-containing protein [Salmonella enterica subsp. enterica]